MRGGGGSRAWMGLVTGHCDVNEMMTGSHKLKAALVAMACPGGLHEPFPDFLNASVTYWDHAFGP